MPEISGRLDTKCYCPNCNKLLDGFTQIQLEGRQPKENDISICLYCATVLTFRGSPLKIERLEGDELIITMAHPDIKHALRVVNSLIEKRKRLDSKHL